MFLFIVILIYLLTYSFTKLDIAQLYDITKPTLRKWIRYFSPRTDYKVWKGRRKFSGWELVPMLLDFGWPGDAGPITKGMLKVQCETEYGTLGDVVALNADRLGFGLAEYREVDVFPPVVGGWIKEIMG
ncbi:hypothetical protein [Lewinella sp. 4G2]|uniref:hypothetical protein n=1 Tax=Lewinella sp. 4G2 TaxID=1803372 RepID=UPI0007B4C3C2|nr:hypothetical protein [Lewinella sp. 4G2]OAV43954.1 hypothetical protein A3850_005355 [Lewinella sp. 4G2]